MAEETMDTGSKSDRKMMSDMAFSEDLKKQLEERIAQSSFTAENQEALSEANMPRYAGKGTQQTATSPKWKGTESVEDSALRMLDDSYKKLRSPIKAPRIPQQVNLRPKPKAKVSTADRLANARDRTSIYAVSQQQDMSEEEREKFRKELKERFTPGARPMPTTLQGLTSLANERIEDAIARGQFKNIQRGKGVNTQRDYNANSPFLDTTEYFMNKIIQKQEIVPPWIEKQQELVKMVNSFRSRLRSDWRRHAARMISATGGSVQDQVRRAKGYALAEDMVNPRQSKKQSMSHISSDGSLVSISVEERIAAGVIEEAIRDDKAPEIVLKITETAANGSPSEPAQIQASATVEEEPDIRGSTASQVEQTPKPAAESNSSSSDRILPTAHPFRDSNWEKAENAYHTLAISELNSFTRSYNLMAPKIAQKTYYNLDRELKRCFSDVAPLLADEILERSRRPTIKIKVIGHKEGGVMDRFSDGNRNWKGHETENFRDEGEEKGYGFKQFWRDLFRKETRQKNIA